MWQEVCKDARYIGGAIKGAIPLIVTSVKLLHVAFLSGVALAAWLGWIYLSSLEFWLIVSILILLTILLIVTRRARKLEELKLELSYNQDIVSAPTNIANQVTNGRWLRIRLENKGTITINQCEPRLIGLVRLDNNQEVPVGFTDRLQLRWAGVNDENSARYIHGGDTCNIAVVMGILRNLHTSRLLLATSHTAPYIQNLFSAPGIYRAKIQVFGEGAKSNILTLDINWTEQWDTYLASVANVTE